jgi:ribosomal protein S18 acetylase RimI-like enzyme
MIIRHADTVSEIGRCFPLMRQLRPRLESVEQFLDCHRRQSVSGYRLVAGWSDEAPVVLAGYRVSENLFHGQHVYVDDLVSDPAHRNKGHAAALLDFLQREAKALGCGQLVLDTAADNLNAQHVYQKSGMTPGGLHFFMKLG